MNERVSTWWRIAVFLLLNLLWVSACGEATIVASFNKSSDTADSVTIGDTDTASELGTASDSESAGIATDSEPALASDATTTDSEDTETATMDTETVAENTETTSADTETVTADTATDTVDTLTDVIDSGSASETGCEARISDASSSPDAYASVDELPNPFQFFDGTPVTSAADWDCRREEIKNAILKIEYGPVAEPPPSVVGVFDGAVLSVNVENDVAAISFDVSVTLPDGTGPFPAFIDIMKDEACVPPEYILDNGIALISLHAEDIASDGEGYTGKFYELYSTPPQTGNLLAWATGVHWIIDALESIADSEVDVSRIAAVGCRRYAKASLLAGALDERVALTVTSGGGSGGINSWRAAEAAAQVTGPEQRETILQISNASSWFTDGFTSNWQNHVMRLPFDAHQVVALVAPRAIIAQEGQFDEYNSNPEGGPYQSMWAARVVYEWLGAGDAIGWVSDLHGNEPMTAIEIAAVMAMARRVFFESSTDVVTFDETATAPVISWSAPN